VRAEELFLELSLRRVDGGVRESWSRQRRSQYLLREDVALPISLDARVTPPARETNAGEVILLGSFIVDTSAEARAIWQAMSAGGESRPKMEGWVSLGYDVCDETFTSGFTNCGYDERFVDEQRRTWSSCINEHHLIDDVDAACRFARFTDLRVPEHAPFFVFRVCSVPLSQAPVERVRLGRKAREPADERAEFLVHRKLRLSHRPGLFLALGYVEGVDAELLDALDKVRATLVKVLA